MGNTSFLTGTSSSGLQSVDEAIFQLENSSLVFLSSWKRIPADLQRAGRVSSEAMAHLDHIVNEILRARDTMRAQGLYAISPLKAQLDVKLGSMSSPVTHAQQQALIAAGPGNGLLPGTKTTITFEKLLNKIKHRHHSTSNFRVDPCDRHILLINVNKPDQTPDSIVEFDVVDFCNQCKLAAPLL